MSGWMVGWMGGWVGGRIDGWLQVSNYLHISDCFIPTWLSSIE
jgi:hypothetical protein